MDSEIEIFEETNDPESDRILDLHNDSVKQLFKDKWLVDLIGDGKITYIIEDVNWLTRLLYRIFHGSKFIKL